jgi:hypothetical protein
MHTGQFRVIRIHRSRFLAGVAQSCWLLLHCAVDLFLLQGTGGGSSVFSSPISLKVTATSLPDGTISVSWNFSPIQARKSTFARRRSDVGPLGIDVEGGPDSLLGNCRPAGSLEAGKATCSFCGAGCKKTITDELKRSKLSPASRCLRLLGETL